MKRDLGHDGTRFGSGIQVRGEIESFPSAYGPREVIVAITGARVQHPFLNAKRRDRGPCEHIP